METSLPSRSLTNPTAGTHTKPSRSRVRQGTLAGPRVRAWWFHRSASIPRPPRPSAAVAPHRAGALPVRGTSRSTRRWAGACSPVSPTGARWRLCRRPAASTPCEGREAQRSEHRRRLGRHEAHDPTDPRVGLVDSKGERSRRRRPTQALDRATAGSEGSAQRGPRVENARASEAVPSSALPDTTTPSPSDTV
jgi:hypothetical protein